MKVNKFLIVGIAIISLVSCNKQEVSNKALTNEIDSLSYTIGLDMALKANVNFSEVNKELFIQGFISGVDSTNILIKSEDINSILSEYNRKATQEAIKKIYEERTKKAELEFPQAKEEGVKFLEENKSKKGINVTESGLQYIALKEGSGEKPKAHSTVKILYKGTLIDGTVFESSTDKNNPSEFRVPRVMDGWKEGLQLMTVGSKYKFFIPQELGFGALPKPGSIILPFATLIYEIELVEILN